MLTMNIYKKITQYWKRTVKIRPIIAIISKISGHPVSKGND